MSEKLAQATATPGNGASNSNDFQPVTRNPQTAPVNLFQQQNGLQNVTNTQELLNDQQNVRISVSAVPAPPPQQSTVPKSPTGLYVLSLVAIVLAIIVFKLSNRFKSAQTVASGTETRKATEAVETAQEKAVEQVPEASQASITPKRSKKATQKKSKRKHR